MVFWHKMSYIRFMVSERLKTATVMVLFDEGLSRVLLELRLPPSQLSGKMILPAETVELWEEESPTTTLYRGVFEEFGNRVKVKRQHLVPEAIRIGETGVCLLPYFVEWSGEVPIEVADKPGRSLIWAPINLVGINSVPSTGEIICKTLLLAKRLTV